MRGATPSRVFLCGYRGTGKTTVAKHLAELLDWKWVDTDDLIEQQSGTTIAAIFATAGEPAFRDLEENVVEASCQLDQTIIALGGGAVVRPATRQRLQTAGPVVWLTADASTLAQRIAGDGTTGTRRPNLTAQGGLAEIEQLLAERAPIYRGCADLEIETARRSPEQIAEQIARWVTSE